VKGIDQWGRKSVWNKAKLIPPLEKPKGKSSFEIFVKFYESEMVKFRSLENHEFSPSINIIIIRIGNTIIDKRSQSSSSSLEELSRESRNVFINSFFLEMFEFLEKALWGEI
jgi:hypothetical protein